MRITRKQIEAGGAAAAKFLDKRFPDGVLPDGQLLFADPGDRVDPNFKHERGCEELAEAILRASLNA